MYEDIEITIAYSDAEMITQSVENVETNLFLAVIISMLVIFIFLGNIRSTHYHWGSHSVISDFHLCDAVFWRSYLKYGYLGCFGIISRDGGG